MRLKILFCLLVISACLSNSFNTVRITSKEKESTFEELLGVYSYDEDNECYISKQSANFLICSSGKYEASWELEVDEYVLVIKDKSPTVSLINDDQLIEIDTLQAEFFHEEEEIDISSGKGLNEMIEKTNENKNLQCITIDEEDIGKPCIFPFRYEGELYPACTTAGDPYKEAWCATDTDQNNGLKKWGHCSQGCLTNADKGMSMMVIGPTGVGKSSLLNSLLCPAKYTNEYEDCFFKTDDTPSSVTEKLEYKVGPWLGENSTFSKPVKLYDSPGLGDSDGSDSETLEGIVDIINSDGAINTILLVFKATDRFSSDIQKQIRTLEYILGPVFWDHVITVFTFWGFGTTHIDRRVRNCIKERKENFDGDVQETRNHCENVDFEKEKVDEWADGYEEFLGITKKIPSSFPHPVFDYNNEDEKNSFFNNAMKIYNESVKMSVLTCNANCQRRLQIALKNEEKFPVIIGREFQQFDAGEEMFLACHLYLGLGNSTVKKMRWLHNSSVISDKQNERITVKSEILLDVIKASQLTIVNATFEDAGIYTCSTVENRILKKSLGVNIKVLKPCKAGYKHSDDSEDCEDIDECEKNIDDCQKNEICINKIGSWQCCPPGFELEDEVCIDIDECESGPGCPDGKSCFNTAGNFTCCESGFELAKDEITCTDINECKDPKICEDRNKQCKNKEGSFQCICIPFSYNWNNEIEDCLCNQGEQSKVCESCNRGAVLIKEKYRTYCEDQITDCNIYNEDLRASGGIKRIEREFPNIDQALIGYNILRGELFGFSKETDPGFTSSPIFGPFRKDHQNDKCEFKGYNPNTSKNCQGSSTSVVYTSSSDLLTSLKEDLNQENIIKAIEVTYDVSENAQFTNSLSFGADVSFSNGLRSNDGNSHCVDRGAANSVEIGETFENNGQVAKGTEETKSSAVENTHTVNVDFGLKASIEAGIPGFGTAGLESTLNSGFEDQNKKTDTKSRTDSLTVSNGWAEGKSRSESNQRSISTNYCEESVYEENLAKEVSNSTSKDEGSLKGTQTTKSFTIPAYLDFVKNSESISNVKKYFKKHEGAIAVSSRICSTYKLEIETKNPPAFTDNFKSAIRDLHDLTLQTNPLRMIVVKTGTHSFNTTLNSATEKSFDSAFSGFIRQYGTHYLQSISMGGGMYVVSKTKKWTNEKTQQDSATACVEAYHRKIFNILDSTSSTNKTSTCKNPTINDILEDQSKIETEEVYSKGAPLGSKDDGSQWSAGNFEQPAPVGLKLQPIVNILISNHFMNGERILARDGSPIDAIGILSWFMPRFSLLTDSCRAMQNYRISADFTSCIKCEPGMGPTEDFRECKACHQLVGHRYSDDRGYCDKCPARQWPNTEHNECKLCDQLDRVRYSDDDTTCVSCPEGLTPSTDSSQCLDCTLDDHLLNPNRTRCMKCSSGTWPRPQGFHCEPCNLIDGVRYSDDRTTCLRCTNDSTPSSDSTECLNCNDWNNYFTNKNKTRCAKCPGGKGATGDHLGCEQIDGEWEDWGLWTSCSKSCLGKDGKFGSRSRQRNCTQHKYGGDPCDPEGFKEIENCAGQGSTITYCAVDGYWEDWGSWSSCSKTCGGGEKRRNRFCNKPQNGGRNCQGTGTETQECNTNSCAVNGYWDGWSGWSSCSRTCGGGEKRRNRFCNKPQNGGRNCQGTETETQPCTQSVFLLVLCWLEEDN